MYYSINPITRKLNTQLGGAFPTPIDGKVAALGPDNVMRVFKDGVLESAVPVPDGPTKDLIALATAKMMLGLTPTTRKRGKKSKPKSRRRKCSCGKK